MFIFVHFPGLLNLVKVGVINICSRKEMSALTTLCPNVKHITISGDAMHLPPGDLLSLRELGLFLSSNTTCWPKVNAKNNVTPKFLGAESVKGLNWFCLILLLID